jgi:hypothetical protein
VSFPFVHDGEAELEEVLMDLKTTEKQRHGKGGQL